MAVAQRVAEERDEKVGQSVGYQVRIKKSESTRILLNSTENGIKQIKWIILRIIWDTLRFTIQPHVKSTSLKHHFGSLSIQAKTIEL